MQLGHVVLVASMAAAVTAGCSTSRQARSADAVASLRDVRTLLERGQGRVDDLQRATLELQGAPAADLRKTYERFARAAKDLRSIAASTRSQALSMRKRGTAYLSAWEKEVGRIQNADLQGMSRERQALLSQDFGRVQAAMAALETAYVAYEKDLTDLETFLGNDLTRAGGDLARPHLKKLADDSAAVRAASEAARTAVSGLEKVLAPK